MSNISEDNKIFENIPKSWDDITIRMWKEVDGVEADNDVTKHINEVSIIVDMDIDEVRRLPMPKYNLLKSKLSFMNEPMKPDVKTIFKLRGVEYGIIPQLDMITTGEWQDVENWKDKSVENMHLLTALIYRPITSKKMDENNQVISWTIEEHKTEGFMERANLFNEELGIGVVWGAVLFFSSSAIGFMESLNTYLEIITNPVKDGKKKTSQKVTKKRNTKHSKKRGGSITS